MGRRDYLTKKNLFTSSGAQGWAEREMGNTNKNTATHTEMQYCYFNHVDSSVYLDVGVWLYDCGSIHA